jgi:acetylornithine deacetylase/succinyl-diaminopimelate desuccinylase-like protein
MFYKDSTMTWQSYLETNQADFETRLLDFLRIPSISSLPEHAGDVRAAGAWVMAQLQHAGMEHVEMLETGGHPVVYADWLHAPDKPTVMIYGHFDTQPVDPLELWDNPPFTPVIKEGRVYARGASDDKGNMLAPVLALEALLKSENGLACQYQVLLRGAGRDRQPDLTRLYRRQQDTLCLRLSSSAPTAVSGVRSNRRCSSG